MSHPPSIAWPDAARGTAFAAWLAAVAPTHRLNPASLRPASADASFRRYFRIDGVAPASGAEVPVSPPGSRIIMDAPPALERSDAFVQIAGLMAQAGLRVPAVLEWDAAHGFLLLSDLGAQTLLDVIQPADPQANLGLYLQAIDALVAWQLASRPGVLPPYDEALLRRELQLFPDWYLGRHRGVVLDERQQATLSQAFDAIVASNLAAPSVYVHRDFMPRNLMAPTPPTAYGSLPPEGAHLALGRPVGETSAAHGTASPLGVLDFQDAVYGPITYDIASLMRDAFLSWEEDFVLEVTVRYWQTARKAGLPVDDDFGTFYRSVEYMGLQRHLKVAGIFARLTLRDGKPKYLADAPRFIGYIRSTASRYRELGPLLQLIDQIEGIDVPTGYAFGRM
ncbi:MAG TPA: phosphotransferase [Burkholderiaceae bacterium]